MMRLHRAAPTGTGSREASSTRVVMTAPRTDRSEDDRPTGTITFLFTDIEGSTVLTEALGPHAYRDVLELHRSIDRR